MEVLVVIRSLDEKVKNTKPNLVSIYVFTVLESRTTLSF